MKKTLLIQALMLLTAGYTFGALEDIWTYSQASTSAITITNNTNTISSSNAQVIYTGVDSPFYDWAVTFSIGYEGSNDINNGKAGSTIALNTTGGSSTGSLQVAAKTIDGVHYARIQQGDGTGWGAAGTVTFEKAQALTLSYSKTDDRLTLSNGTDSFVYDCTSTAAATTTLKSNNLRAFTQGGGFPIQVTSITGTVRSGFTLDGTTYNSMANNVISDTSVDGTQIVASRLLVNTADNATKMSNNGGKILIAEGGQAYVSGGVTLSNDFYIGGSDIYTETSGGYTYSGDIRLESNSTINGSINLLDDATIATSTNSGTFGGAVNGADKSLTVNVAAGAGILHFNGGGELGSLTAEQQAAQTAFGIAFGSNKSFSVGTLTTNRQVILDENALLFVGEDTTLPKLTLNSGSSITLGTEESHDHTLMLTDLVVNGTATVNADLNVTGSMNFAAGSTLTMGCNVTIGGNTVLTVADTVNTAPVTLFTDVESLTLGTQAITGMGWYDANGILASVNGTEITADGQYVIGFWNGTVSVAAANVPEPATAALSLLALAGLCARRRRH